MSGRQAFAVFWGLALTISAAAPAPGDEPAPAGDGLPEFRRVFIPAGETHDRQWPGRYLAIDADEFEKLLQTVYDGARGAPDAHRAHLENADYTARVVDEEMLVGSATLGLSSRSDQATLWVLDPCSVALESARWNGPPAKPALLGAGPDGRVRLLVEGSQLQLDWSQRGERTASGSVTFQLKLPRCPMTRIALEAPVGQEIVTDRGVVTKTAGPAKTGMNRWSIELGGHEQVTLRIVPEDRGRRPLTLLRQSLSYEFSPRGVNVTAQLRLDVHGEPLERATIDLDPSLHLVSAKYGKQAVPWSATIDADSGAQQVLLEFPEPVSGTGRLLQLSAVAPLVIGQRVLLPGLRPRNMAWQEGTVELVIRDALVLEQLETQGCRQSRVTALPAPLAGESIEIQFYEPGATIAALVAEPRKRLPIAVGTLVEVGTDEITSDCAFGLDLPSSGRRRVRIGIQAPWTIDSVERLTADRSVEWDVEQPPGGPAELTIEIDEPGRFVVRGRRPPPGEATFDGRQLQMLDLSQFDATTRLIRVRAAEGWEAHWENADGLDRRDAANLDPEELQLFARLPDGPVVSESDDFVQSSLTLTRRRPNYAVAVHIDVAVQDDTLSETFTIQCEPDATRVERLLIQFSQARDEPLQWGLAGGNSGQFSARKLTAREQDKAGMPPGGDVWELLLRLTRAGPFELRAQRLLPFDAETPLALVSVADATAQQGTLAIRALGETGLEIKNRRLIAVPAELLEQGRYQTARATYHYQPSGDELGSQPAVSLVPASAQQAETGAWAWTSRLTSRFARDGTCVHQATFLIQTAGRGQIHLKMPDEAKLLSAWVDNRRLSPAVVRTSAKGSLVELPSGHSRATLSLYYSTPTALPALVARQTPPMPTVGDVPVLLRQWTIWLPPGYEIADADGAPIDGLTPRGWSDRLFGPLGRGAAGHVFNPLVAADWRETFAGGGSAQLVYQDCQQAIRNLGTHLGNYLNDEELTWGQLLSSSSKIEATFGRVLLVDAESLAELGLTPQTRVGLPPPADSPLERGSKLLGGAKLAVIAAPGIILLTAADDAAYYRRQLWSPRPGLIHTTLNGPLVDQMRNAALAAGWSRFETIRLWRAGLPYQTTSWERPERAPLAASDPSGWARYTLQFSQSAQPRVRIVRTDAMRSLAWAVFLALVALGIWKPVARPWAVVAVVGAAAAVALVVPSAYAPLASATLLAGLFSLAVRMTRPQPIAETPPGDPPQASHKRHSSTIQPVATILLLAALIHAAVGLDAAQPAAAQPDETPPAARAPQYRVFVPVDEDQTPTGGKFYVPAELYEDLLRRAAAISGRPKEWIVTRAAYQGALSRDAVSSRLGLAELTARFDLRVFQANVPVSIPLERASWGDAIEGARLDGRQIPVVWNTAGDALMLGMLAIDTHRLELDLQPSVPTDAPQAGFDLPIPKLPQATFELSGPQEGPAIEVPTARGQVVVDKQRGQLVARLGPSDRLAARWLAGGGTESAPPNLEAEELIWLKVRPGTTVLDARFKFRVLAGRVRQLSLLTDPRLSLLSSPDSRQVTIHTIPGDPQRVELELARDVADEIVVDLSFLVSGTSGVGYLRLPRLESAGARASRRWLGVSVDPALQPNIQAGEDSRSLGIGEFIAAWGDSDDKPRAAFSISRGEPVWVLSTQPSEPRASVEQTLAVSLGRRRARLRYDADISIEGGVLVQLGLTAPPGIVVERVSMLEDGVQRIARWSVDPAGRISVFLNAPIDGRQELSLTGHWDPATPEAFEVPRVRVLSADLQTDELHLYRQPAVLITLEKRAGARDLEPADIELQDGFGFLGGCYALEEDAPSIRIKLSQNNPKLHAKAVTYLERDGDRWMAELNYHVEEITGGLADTLRFQIPPQWSQPFRVDPAMRYEVVSIPGDQRRELVLYPDGPFAGKQQIRIRGRVAPLPGDRLSVPDIVPLRARQLERFVVLPRQLESQQVTWDTLGLSQAELPPELVARGPEAPRAGVYRVPGEHFQASLKAVERATAVARVELLDVQLVVQADGSYQAVAAFDIEPGGSTQCVLQLPGGCSLVHASVEQLPAVVSELGNDRWRLGLGPQQLPQRIEVIYTGSSGQHSLRRFEAPRLVGLEIGQVLWTIYGLPQFGPARARQSVDPAEQHVKRLDTIAALVELPAEVVSEHLPEEIARWYGAWRKRYGAGRAALRSELIAAHRQIAPSPTTVAARRLDKRIGFVDERLGAPRAGSRRILLGNASTQLAALARVSMLPMHYTSDDEPYRLDIYYPQTTSDGLLGRILAGLAILLLCGAAAWWLRPRTLPTFAPWVVASGVGLAWWLLLAPSVLGLLACSVASCTALWSHWRSGRPEPMN